ncbi:MAG TPA: cell division protein FtsL [Actinomycetota bacterium]|nr:cell division protein FtsL [Actinomycetota bacterium]
MAPTLIVAAIAVVTLVFGVLLEQIALAQSAFRLSAIRERLVAAEERYEKLMHEAVLLDNPSRIERIATERLGMVEPNPRTQKFVVARIRMKDRRAALAALRHDVAPAELGTAAAVASEGTSP